LAEEILEVVFSLQKHEEQWPAGAARENFILKLEELCQIFKV